MLLTEEQELIRDTARAFAQEKVLPNVRAWEAAGEIPRPLLAEMGKLGFMGMTVPPEWGGAGANMVSYVLALEEIAAADGGLSDDGSTVAGRTARRRGIGCAGTGSAAGATAGAVARASSAGAVTSTSLTTRSSSASGGRITGMPPDETMPS